MFLESLSLIKTGTRHLKFFVTFTRLATIIPHTNVCTNYSTILDFDQTLLTGLAIKTLRNQAQHNVTFTIASTSMDLFA